MRNVLQPITYICGFFLFACSASIEDGQSPGTGGSLGNGGSRSSGGTQSATGGTVTAQGGLSATGGNASGGSSTGGVAQSGGAPQSGGAGGASHTGGTGPGKNTGGSATTTGGASTGGTNPGGGRAATGGSVAVGGSGARGGSSPTGGRGSTGGTSAGGTTSSTGGTTPTGGVGSVPKFVGNITTRDAVDTGGMKFSKYWDQITPENAGKWGTVQSSPSAAFNWRVLDTVSTYAQTNNIILKHHCFVWGSQQPSGSPTLAQVENWIKSYCERYPATKLIDVVNEPPPHTTPNYTSALGAGEKGSYPWITKAFKLARQYCPSAILILNDYNNLEYSSQADNFINIVKDIKANGAPIDAVGCQGHAMKGLSASTVQSAINKMATGTGLPVYITEYDIGDANDSSQASTFQAQFPIFLNTAAVHGVTVWGWIDGATWVSNTGLVKGTTPRAAMTWLMGQLKRPVPPN